MVTTNAVQSSFIGGLKTEFTGLNFPENACTDTDNCVFTLIGEVLRREGINFETNNALQNINTASQAINYYHWVNAGGDGETQILVVQVGGTLYFFKTSNASTGSPMSAQLLSGTVSINTFLATGSTATPSLTECQFADGNGYLFVYHPNLDPFFCSISGNTITANIITIQIRDFTGINDGLTGALISNRPSLLTQEHLYNLQNQGWTQGAPWNASSSTQINVSSTSTYTFSVPSGISGITNGQVVGIEAYSLGSLIVEGSGEPLSQGQIASYATVNSYTASTMVLSVYSVVFPVQFHNASGPLSPGGPPYYSLVPVSTGYISTWLSAEGNYPSNADVWWVFKDTSGDFSPATTAGNITLNSGQAPQGHYILNAFNQDRTVASGTSGLTAVTTTVRPRTGCWFGGRVWFSGVDSSQVATGDAAFYTWTENIYFSTIVSGTPDFGTCYQTNDPTSENLSDELPSDGGVIVIQGCGAVYKLFPMQNGVLVFAQNGVWIIRGGQSLGFTATDYSVNKVSEVQSISGTSFISVQGMPMFWNEEGIYAVEPSKDNSPYGFGGLSVNPITVGTILTFYNSIPRDSKRYARGDYNPITYNIEWLYRSEQESGIANRYQFDSALNLNVYNRAFYPYSISNNNACYVNGLVYISYPNGVLDPTFKYLTSVNTQFTFSEENDDVNFLDWFSYDNTGVDYTSFFITGYNLHGKAIAKWSNTYVYMYLGGADPSAYTIQGIWDYANTGNSGRYTNVQQITNFSPNYNNTFRRHKIRGHGMSLQIYVSSISGQPFTIQGWAMADDIDRGI